MCRCVGQVIADIQGALPRLVNDRNTQESGEFDDRCHIGVSSRRVPFRPCDENSPCNAQRAAGHEQIPHKPVSKRVIFTIDNEQRRAMKRVGGLSENERGVDQERLLCVHHSL